MDHLPLRVRLSPLPHPVIASCSSGGPSGSPPLTTLTPSGAGVPRYDFGYLLKLLTCAPLPNTEEEFNELLRIYFPIAYDMKYCMKFCDSLHGGLQKLAEVLDVERIGPQHQAGSDSLLTACTFFKLQKSFFSPESHIGPIEKYKNVLYGAMSWKRRLGPFRMLGRRAHAEALCCAGGRAQVSGQGATTSRQRRTTRTAEWERHWQAAAAAALLRR